MSLDLFTPESNRLLTSIYSMLGDNASPSLGEFIERRCDEIGVSGRQLAEATGVSHTKIQAIINGDRQKADLLTLLRIAQFLRIESDDLIKMYVAGAPPEDVGSLERSHRAGYLAANFDLRRLREIGFIDSSKDYEAAEERIKTYFGLERLTDYSTLDTTPAFSKARPSGVEKMIRFWVNLVHAQFRRLRNPNDFDRARLIQVIPKLRAATLDEERGFTAFVRELYSCGVTVVVESYVTTTQVKGATFNIEGRPCVVLTNFQKRYDTLWFTLAHELSHVLNDLDVIKRQGYHVTGEQELLMNETLEQVADTFARRLLLPDEQYRLVSRYIDIDAMVKEYARAWNVHPSIIYGRYLREHADDYPKYRKRIPDSSTAIRHHEVEPWKKTKYTTLDETLPHLQRSLMTSS